MNKKLLLELQQFINNNRMIVESKIRTKKVSYEYMDRCLQSSDIGNYIDDNKEPAFVTKLFSYIDKSGKKDSEIYTKAGIDRRLFSKIRSNEEYHLSKSNVIALCLALELNLSDSKDLLSTSGYTLSNSSNFDLIIMFFIYKEIYDLSIINEALYKFNLKTIGVAI